MAGFLHLGTGEIKNTKALRNKKECIYLQCRFSTFRAYSVTAEMVADSTERLTGPHLRVRFLFYRWSSWPAASCRSGYTLRNNTLFQGSCDKPLCPGTSQYNKILIYQAFLKNFFGIFALMKHTYYPHEKYQHIHHCICTVDRLKSMQETGNARYTRYR